jgi:hypothetical protein
LCSRLPAPIRPKWRCGYRPATERFPEVLNPTGAMCKRLYSPNAGPFFCDSAVVPLPYIRLRAKSFTRNVVGQSRFRPRKQSKDDAACHAGPAWRRKACMCPLSASRSVTWRALHSSYQDGRASGYAGGKDPRATARSFLRQHHVANLSFRRRPTRFHRGPFLKTVRSAPEHENTRAMAPRALSRASLKLRCIRMRVLRQV